MAAISVAQYADKLAYAAGQGAKKIASSATATGNIQARTGVAVPTPGPALRSVLAGSGEQSIRATTATNTGRVAKVANRMAKNVLRQGAELLSEDT